MVEKGLPQRDVPRKLLSQQACVLLFFVVVSVGLAERSRRGHVYPPGSNDDY